MAPGSASASATGSRRPLMTVLLCAVVGLSSCGDDSGSGGLEKPAKTAEPEPTATTVESGRKATVRVVTKDMAFAPQYVSVRVGQTIEFVNEDKVAHSVETDEGQSFASKALEPGDTYSVKVKDRKILTNISYFCAIHPETMSGGFAVTD